MEGINIKLKAIDTVLPGGIKTSKDTEEFSEILNILMGIEQADGSIFSEVEKDINLDLEKDPEEKLEEAIAYILEPSILDGNISKDYENIQLINEEKVDIELFNSKASNTIEPFIESGVKENLDEIATEFSNLSKESSIKTDTTDTKAIEDIKTVEGKSFSQEIETKDLKSKGLENIGLENKESLNVKDDNLNSKPLTLKNNLHKDVERILNLETFKEQSPKDDMSLDLKSENIGKNPEEKLSNKEDIEIKPFSLEDMQNSFRKIEVKDIYSKEINTSKLSQENMDMLKDSIVKLIEIKDETKSMNVKLIPRELGSIDISLKMEEGKLVAKILFENEQARQLFSNNIKDLSQSLQRQDISIEEIQIDLSSNNHGGSNSGNQEHQTPFKNRNIKFEEIDIKEKISTRNTEGNIDGVSILV